MTNFSTSELQKTVRSWGVLYFFTCKCASHYMSTSELQKVLQNPQVFLTCSLENVLRATAACNFSTSELQKVLPDPLFFTFSLANALRAPAACNFSTSWCQKVLPEPVFFKHVHLQMCFALQQRATFRHLDVKKCSQTLCLLRFSLANVLRTTAACNFCASELQKAVRSWGVLMCFVHFHLQMCFALHFDISTSKSTPGPAVFLTFSLENVLRATAACNFRFILWPHDSAPAALTGLRFDCSRESLKKHSVSRLL